MRGIETNRNNQIIFPFSGILFVPNMATVLENLAVRVVYRRGKFDNELSGFVCSDGPAINHGRFYFCIIRSTFRRRKRCLLISVRAPII